MPSPGASGPQGQPPVYAKASSQRRLEGSGRLNQAEVGKALARLPWLKAASRGELNLLSQLVCMNQIVVPKHGVIYHEGVVGDRLYLLVKGAVRLWSYSQKISRDVRGVDSFGEAQIVVPGPRDTTAVALTTSVVLFLRHDDLLKPPPPAARRNSTRRTSLQHGNAPSVAPSTQVDVHELKKMMVVSLMRAKLWAPPAEDKQKPIKAAIRHLPDVVPAKKYMRNEERRLSSTSSHGSGDTQTRMASKLGGHADLNESTLAIEEFVAAGQLGWLRKATSESGWDRLRLPAGNHEDGKGASNGYSLGDVGGIVYGRTGTPPDHLLGVRPREQRLGKELLHEAHERAERMLAHIADSDAHGLVHPDQWLDALPMRARAMLQQYIAAH